MKTQNNRYLHNRGRSFFTRKDRIDALQREEIARLESKPNPQPWETWRLKELKRLYRKRIESRAKGPLPAGRLVKRRANYGRVNKDRACRMSDQTFILKITRQESVVEWAKNRIKKILGKIEYHKRRNAETKYVWNEQAGKFERRNSSTFMVATLQKYLERWELTLDTYEKDLLRTQAEYEIWKRGAEWRYYHNRSAQREAVRRHSNQRRGIA